MSLAWQYGVKKKLYTIKIRPAWTDRLHTGVHAFKTPPKEIHKWKKDHKNRQMAHD